MHRSIRWFCTYVGHTGITYSSSVLLANRLLDRLFDMLLLLCLMKQETTASSVFLTPSISFGAALNAPLMQSRYFLTKNTFPPTPFAQYTYAYINQCHPHKERRSQITRQKCFSHNSSYHDIFISYRVSTEGASTFVCTFLIPPTSYTALTSCRCRL